MKQFKKITAMILVVLMLFSSTVLVSSAKSDYTPAYDLETPVIFIHGMGQNDTFLLNEDGTRKLNDKGEPMTGWPLQIDIMGLLKHALPGLLASIVTRKDTGLSKGLEKGAMAALANVAKDNEGNYLTPVEVPCIPYAYDKMTEEEMNDCYEHIPVKEMTDLLGEDMVYYFGYDTFGNVADTAEILHKYITEIVLPQTGAKQVAICPISLGGTIAVKYLEDYPEDHKYLKRVLFFVPAINGSDIVGDILTYNLSVFDDDETLYGSLMPKLLGDSYLAYLLNMVLRILPSDVLKSGLRGLVTGVVNVAIRSCTQMWALCPDEYYEEARELWLSDDAYASIRKEVDEFMVARKNIKKNLDKLQAGGTEIFNLVCYGSELFPLSKDYKTTNADGIIDAESTSFGATFADLGTTFPEGYKAAGTYCTDPTHDHISPDRTVDPSTCLFPCRTWFFKGQAHEKLASNDVAIKLSIQLLCDDNMKDVYSNPEAYPQYNSFRLTKEYKLNKELWAEADKSKYTAEQIKAVEDAIVKADAFLTETVIDNEGWTKAEAEFNTALVNVGLLEDKTPTAFENVLTTITKNANRVVNKAFKYIEK